MTVSDKMSETARCISTARSLTTNSVLARGAVVQPTQIDPSEEWRPVPDYEGMYEVSSLGRVKSLPRKRVPKEKILVLYENVPRLRMQVSLHRDGISVLKVHQLVARVFIGPRPPGLEVRHLNGDHTDNRVENLAYGTHLENMEDQRRHGKAHRRTTCKLGHPLTVIQVEPQRRECRTCCNAGKRRRRSFAREQLDPMAGAAA